MLTLYWSGSSLKGVMRSHTNLAQVREVMQGPTEPPFVFLESKKQTEMPDLKDWLTAFPRAWAETGGMGMAVRVPLWSWD